MVLLQFSIAVELPNLNTPELACVALAVARKLAVLLHRVWTTGADYVPLRATAEPRG